VGKAGEQQEGRTLVHFIRRALGAGWGRDWTKVAAGEGVKVGVGPGEREGRREGAGEEGWGGSGEGEEEEREQGGEERMERVL
jgi:hypothetical protein